MCLKSRRISQIIVMVLCVLSCVFTGLPVHGEDTLTGEGIDPETKGSITIRRSWDAEWPTQGTVLHLYRIADLNDDMTFSCTEKFKGDKEVLPSSLSVPNSSWDELTDTLVKQIDQKKMKPDASVTWNTKNGDVVFDGLKTGLYLVTADNSVINGKNYVSKGNLISMPSRDSISDPWNDSVSVEMKYDVENINKPGKTSSSVTPVPKKTRKSSESPDTGDHFNGWSYFSILVVMCALAGMIGFTRMKERKN